MSKKKRILAEIKAAYDLPQLLNYVVIVYANLWFQKDRRYVENCKKDEVSSLSKTLADIAGDYRVSRTLPSQKLVKEWELLARFVVDVDVPAITNDNYISVVTKLATKMEKAGKTPLSAASKFLWFRCGAPVKMYDSRAVDALRAMGYRPGYTEYDEFCGAWLRAFEEHRADLFAAIGRVCERVEYTFTPMAEHKNFHHLAFSPNFVERAFDQYLWLLGDPDEKKQPDLLDTRQHSEGGFVNDMHEAMASGDYGR